MQWFGNIRRLNWDTLQFCENATSPKKLGEWQQKAGKISGTTKKQVEKHDTTV